VGAKCFDRGLRYVNMHNVARLLSARSLTCWWREQAASTSGKAKKRPGRGRRRAKVIVHAPSRYPARAAVRKGRAEQQKGRPRVPPGQKLVVPGTRTLPRAAAASAMGRCAMTQFAITPCIPRLLSSVPNFLPISV
jgi:hypothetical protein